MRSINRNILFKLDAFLNDIEDNLLCPYCGCSCFGGVCDNCGKKNEEFINISNQITEYIKTIDEKLLNDTELNFLLNKIFQFKKYGIGSVYKLLSNTKYEETVKKACSRINNSYPDIIHNHVNLTNEEYDLLVNLPLNNSYISNDTLVNICSIALVNKESNLDKKLSNCQKILKKFVEYIEDSSIKININFVDSDKMCCEMNDSKAFYDVRNITVSNKKLVDNPLYIYSVIFHELIHQQQDNNLYKYQTLSQISLMQIMDKILIKEYGSLYFHENRYWNSIELEARAFQYRDMIAYFTNLFVDIPDGIREAANERQNTFINFINSKDINIRKCNGKNINIFDLFTNCIYDKTMYLKLYPQLEFLYKIENGYVVPKTIDELKIDYDKFRNGELSWCGDKFEINNLYKKFISIKEKSPVIVEKKKKIANNKSISGYSGVWLLTLLSGLFTTILFLFITFLFK